MTDGVTVQFGVYCHICPHFSLLPAFVAVCLDVHSKWHPLSRGLLPPASEGWGKVLFSVCLSVHISGRVPQSGLGRGSTPSQVWTGGTPSQVWGGGYPIQVWGGGYPIQVWMVGGVPWPGFGGGGTLARFQWGVPHPGLDGGRYPGQILMVGGYPGQVLMVGGYLRYPPWLGLDGGGYPRYPPPSRPGWGPPHPGMGYPPTINTWIG